MQQLPAQECQHLRLFPYLPVISLNAICAINVALNTTLVSPNLVPQSTLQAIYCRLLFPGKMWQVAKLAALSNAHYCPKQTQLGLQNKHLAEEKTCSSQYCNTNPLRI